MTARSSEEEHPARDRGAGDSNSPAPTLRLLEPGEPGGVPLLAIAGQNAGILRAGSAVSVLIQWSIAEAKVGHELGQGEGLSAAVREYAKYWRMSERTAWRDLDRFRRGFPSEESPGRITAHWRAHVANTINQGTASTVPVFAAA